MRYVLQLSYKGTNYHGWQIQKNAHTVQNELNSAISKVLKMEIETFGSGRTDTGVHANQQYAQFDFANIENAAKFIFQLNAILPYDIFIQHIYQVKDDFSVRFDAEERSYQYRISLTKNPFLKDLCCYYFRPIPDIQLMNEACSLLFKYTDFQSFSKYKTNVLHFDCQITQAYWALDGDLLIFHVSANRFLRGMVRTIVGTLLEVGQKNISVADFEQIILKRNRIYAKTSAPPEGLFLTEVVYPSQSLHLLA
ncbi:MAG: tRNA pseudouridine(38-40) synthase TruA [Cytophagales bacterium]